MGQVLGSAVNTIACLFGKYLVLDLAPQPPIQLPINVHLERQQAMARVLGSMPPTWKTEVESPSDFSLTQVATNAGIWGEDQDRRFFCFSVSKIK